MPAVSNDLDSMMALVAAANRRAASEEAAKKKATETQGAEATGAPAQSAPQPALGTNIEDAHARNDQAGQRWAGFRDVGARGAGPATVTAAQRDALYGTEGGTGASAGQPTHSAHRASESAAHRSARSSGSSTRRISAHRSSARHAGQVRRSHRPGSPSQTNRPSGGAPANRTATTDSVRKAGQLNQMTSGRVTINGHTYQYNSGGSGRGNLPKGQYSISAFKNSTNQPGMVRDGVGFSFAMSDKRDPRTGTTRELLRIHPDGGGAGTAGCMGIVGNAATLRQFRNDMNAELRRNGGRFNLTIN